MNCLSLFPGSWRNSVRETKCCRPSSASFPLAFFLSLDENAIFAKQPNDPSTYATFVLEKSERRRRPDVGVAATLGALSIKIKFSNSVHYSNSYITSIEHTTCRFVYLLLLSLLFLFLYRNLYFSYTLFTKINA